MTPNGTKAGQGARRRPKPQRSAVECMYNAIMSISFVLGGQLYSVEAANRRAGEIANAALREMNSEHTKEVQKALGLGDD